MIKYPSIESVWTRDKETSLLIPGAVRKNVWKNVGLWYLTEKVDGKNIRIILGHDGEKETVEVRGRGDGNLPQDLVQNILADIAPRELHYHLGITAERPVTMTLYGEGYGPGIQKVGKLYRDDKAFILFDIRQGNAGRGFWWDFSEVIVLARKTGLDMVPIVGTLNTVNQVPRTAEEMDELIGHSRVANEWSTREGDEVEMEGFVARPLFEMQDAHGNRIMFKLTYRDLYPLDAARKEV